MPANATMHTDSMTIDTGLLAAILGSVAATLLIVVVALTLRMRTVSPRTTAERMGAVVISIDSGTRERVAMHIADASLARGQRKSATTLPDRIRYGRVLWIDNDPDFSASETLALEALGVSVTKTMHADIAMKYLSDQAYSVLVAGLVEDSRPAAIASFLEHVRTVQPGIVTVGYASPGLSSPISVGGLSTVRDPADVINVVATSLEAR